MSTLNLLYNYPGHKRLVVQTSPEVVRIPPISKVRTKFKFNIKSETDFSDSNVTLACGEDRQIHAHKWGIAQSRNQCT